MQRRAITANSRRVERRQPKGAVVVTKRQLTPMEQQRMHAAVDAFLTELARQEISRMRRHHG